LHKSLLAGMFLLYFALLPQVSVAAEVKDCGLKRYASIDLAGADDGYLLVPVTMQGTRAYMVLNMATPFSSVMQSAVDSLSLQVKPMAIPFGTSADTNPMQHMATATPFEFGGIRFRSATFMVMPPFRFREMPADAPVVGVLAMDVLKGFDIELDAGHRKMNLFSQDHCPGHTVYWSAKYDSAPIRFGSLGEFYFPMELEGKKLETTLATSNPMTTLNTDATRKLFNFDSQSEGVETETDKSGRTTAHYRAMKLSGEGLEIINARISLIDPLKDSRCHLSSRLGAATYEGCFGVHPLALGENVITRLHFYIATKEKVLYFTPANPTE
jgi:hypothetical protein